jgi:hypothetical protein
MIDDPRCRACRSKKREEIDRGLRAGRSVREIGEQYGIPKSAIGRHRAHLDVEVVDAKGEAAHAASLLEEFLALPLEDGADVLRRGKVLLDAQVRVARSLMPDNPRAASGIIARASSALVELHARAYKVVGSDAQPPALIDNSVRILAVLDRMDPDALRALTGQEKPVAIAGEVTRGGS